MRLLILGGTVFLGRHLVDAALARGHELTLFNRGQHNPDLYPQVEKLRGDRDGDLTALAGRRWDAVIDTCGYVPRIVAASATALSDSVEHYTFISTLSVFANVSRPGADENTRTAVLEEEGSEDYRRYYGPLKALSEQAAEAAMPGRVLTIRPGLIVGPYDQSDRFTYWPARIARGGDVLAPGRAERPVQIIDVRDLADWNIRMVEEGRTGIYNATGPDYTLTMAAMLAACKAAANSDARMVWVDEQFLLDEGVAPWRELPVWLPESGEMAGLLTVNCTKSFAAGLTFRPTETTARDTLAWDRERHERAARDSEELPNAAGLAPEREQELLAAWRDRVATS